MLHGRKESGRKKRKEGVEKRGEKRKDEAKSLSMSASHSQSSESYSRYVTIVRLEERGLEEKKGKKSRVHTLNCPTSRGRILNLPSESVDWARKINSRINDERAREKKDF